MIVSRKPAPGWRNWQTRQTQNLVLAREWEFDPPSGHHTELRLSRRLLILGYASDCRRRINPFSVSMFLRNSALALVPRIPLDTAFGLAYSPSCSARIRNQFVVTY